MEILPEIANRRSIRAFLPEAIEQATLDRVLEAGRRAPSAKNRQAWRFILVTRDETRRALQDACFGQEYVGQAAAILALCTTNIDYKMPNDQYSHPVDIGIASAFMMLQAEHEGLGTCAMTTFSEPEVKAILSVPYKMRVVMLIVVGKPGESPEITDRFPPERIFGYEHW